MLVIALAAVPSGFSWLQVWLLLRRFTSTLKPTSVEAAPKTQ